MVPSFVLSSNSFSSLEDPTESSSIWMEGDRRPFFIKNFRRFNTAIHHHDGLESVSMAAKRSQSATMAGRV